jgi:Family of unknown function (DUF6519)
MKGDFTRSTFRPDRRYRSVRMQQGRVQLDADWNEELDILGHIEDTTRIDEIGSCGVPKSHPGFGIDVTPDGTDLTISAGRLYADGILCELDSTAIAVTDVQAGQVTAETLVADGFELAAPQWIAVFDSALATPGETLARITGVDEDTRVISFDPALAAATVTALTGSGALPAVRRVVSYTTQRDLPAPDLADPGTESGPPAVDLPDGRYVVYADVWERHLTALDDPLLRESALGGPDTTTRTKAVCQVRLSKVGDDVGSCDELPDLVSLLDQAASPGDRRRSTGRLSARSQPSPATTTPCVIPPGAGYRRLENQLYRVEVHTPGPLGTATFVWSRENASVATLWTGPTGGASTELTVSSIGRDSVLGFASGQLVELIDDTLELQGSPGTLVTLAQPPSGQTLTLSAPVDRSQFPATPKVRRWDVSAETTVTVPSSNDGFLPLEDGVEVRFETGYFNTGDYWLIPARTAKGDVEWPEDGSGRPVPRGPDGIAHHYCPLALVEASSSGSQPITVLDDCRTEFPSLTSICAEDVCLDEGFCDIKGVRTVQDALDVLCEESTLRRHKQHLHGWGIVCGLAVDCAGVSDQTDDGPIRRNVTVREGYAIDCEGNDVWLAADETVDLLSLVETNDGLVDGDPEAKVRRILSHGDGDACLTVALDPDGAGHTFAVEAFDPDWNTTQSLLAGTLLMDFYQECVSPVVEFLKKELTPPKDDEGDPASPAFQREAILAGLLAQILDQGSGQTIYISRREDEILHEFYDSFRGLLQSETFCAMFDGARPFPPYPENVGVLDTIFGRGHHVRMRLRPGKKGAQEAYTVGPGPNPLKPSTSINRYDLPGRRLLSRVDPIAGTAAGGSTDSGSGAVADVAFSPDGGRIYMIAPTRDGANTFFRAGDITDASVNWGDLVMLCDVNLSTLGVTGADPSHVYAVGPNGLYRIDPSSPDTSMPLLADASGTAIGGFSAAGQLVMTSGGMAVATASRSGGQSGSYDTVVVVDVVRLVRSDNIDLGATGSDDIAVQEAGKNSHTDNVYCVVGPDSSPKRVVGFTLAGDQLKLSANLQDTPVRLAVYEPENVLIATLEQANCVATIDLEKGKLANSAQVPTQVSPISLASDTGTETAYALNYVSNTITVIPGARLSPKYEFPFEDLANYRSGILESIYDLAGGFLQYLKDCFCHHLLVNCPTCDDDEKLYLACVSIRGGSVYNVCNFSRRRYVKSFPTVGYWLSIVPIVPILHRLVEQFCCWVIPEVFSRYTVAPYDATAVGVASGPNVPAARSGITMTQGADVPARARVVGDQLRLASTLGIQMIGRGMRSAARARPLALPGLVNRPVAAAHASLADAGIASSASSLDALGFGDLLRSVAGVVLGRSPDDHVALHEEEGTVRLASVARGPSPTANVDALTKSVEDKTAEIEELRTRVQKLERTERRLATLERRLSALGEEPRRRGGSRSE